MIRSFMFIFLVCCQIVPISPSPSSFVLNSLQLQPALDFSNYYYQFVDVSTLKSNLINDEKTTDGINKEIIDDISNIINSNDDENDSDIDEPIVAQKMDGDVDESEESDVVSDENDNQDDNSNKNGGGDGDDNGDNNQPSSSYRFTTKTLNIDSSNDAIAVEVKVPTVQTTQPVLSLSSQIAQVWNEFIEKAPSDVQLQHIVTGNVDTSEPYESIVSLPSSSSSTAAAALKANGTDHTSFHRQLLAQFLSPLARGDQRALWLDPELVLNLRGQLILATSGDSSSSNGDDNSDKSLKQQQQHQQYRRGLRLSCPSGTCTMVKAIITALTQSVQAGLAVINRRTLESVRHRVSRRFDVPLESLTMEVLVESLFQHLHQSQRRSVVCLQDEMNWFVHQPGFAKLLRNELQSSGFSRLFFLQVDPDAPLVPGYSPSEARVKQQGPTVASLTAQDTAASGIGNSPNQFSFPGFSFPPPPSSSSSSSKPQSSFRPSSQLPSSANNNRINQQQNNNNNNMPPQNNHPNNNMMMPQPIGQSFQILIKNGTATINPIPSIVPPGSLSPFPNGMSPQGGFANNPFGFPPGMMVPMSPQGGQGSRNMGEQMPNPPEALMRAITEQRLRQQQQQGGGNNNNMGMTAEDMKVFMSDPTNRAAMQEFLENVMKMAQSQIPPGTSLTDNTNGNNNNNDTDDESQQSPVIEVKVHMMSVPMMLPPGMNMNNLPPHLTQQLQQQAAAAAAAAQQQQQGTQQQQALPTPEATITAKNSKKQQQPSSRFPGIFFKNKDSESSNNKNTTATTATTLPTASTVATSTTAAVSSSGSKKKGLGKASDVVREKLSKLSSLSSLSSSTAAVDATATSSSSSTPPTPLTKRTTRVSSVEAAKELELLTSPSLFPELVITPPRDHSLRVLWERMADDEMGKKVAKLNRRLLEREIKRTGTKLRHLPLPSSSSSSPTTATTSKSVLYSATLTDVLSRRVLLPEEVSRSVQSATLFQAGLGHTHSSISSSSNSHNSQQAATTTNNDSSSATATTMQTEGGVSLWAMDAGLCSAGGLPVPRLGRSATRSLEELFASITDKHERALLGNVISPAEIGVSYDMIGGLTDVKRALQQCITYPLKYPRLYSEGVAAEGIKGVLLFGPPGTGKTMLAKAVATEGGATFLSVDPSTIENKWLGESEKNARAVFTLARKLAPCVIYLDEVDSLLSSREGGDDSSHGTLTSVKTTLMQEWDGLRTTKDRVVVIASTNRPFDLDEAVLRRLPRRILVDLPDQQTRQEILSVTLSGNRLAPDVNLTKIAMQLEGYTGSDVKEVCREAVVRVCHERARIEEGLAQAQVPVSMSAISTTSAATATGTPTSESEATSGVSDSSVLEDMDSDAPLRPVSAADFTIAMRKLKASVSETSREAERVAEWNSRFGEVKKGSGGAGSTRAAERARQQLNMYV